MNDLQIFIYGGEQLRTIQQPDGLWWVLRDVCQVLGLAEPHRVASRLDDDEKGRTQMTTPGGTQDQHPPHRRLWRTARAAGPPARTAGQAGGMAGAGTRIRPVYRREPQAVRNQPRMAGQMPEIREDL